MPWIVKLTKTGEDDIIATNVEKSEDEISCRFDLSGAAPGLWDVVVINEEGKYDIYENGFEVLEIPPEASISSIAPSQGGLNKIITINGIKFGNQKMDSRVIFRQGEQQYIADLYMNAWSDNQIKVYAPEIPNLGEWEIVVQVVSNEEE